MDKIHSMCDWVTAVRPWSFPASSMPVVVSLAYLYWAEGSIDWYAGLWALLTIVLFHASGNTWSDYHDYLRGVDAADTIGVQTLTERVFRPKEIRCLSFCLLATALLSGLGLILHVGWPLLVFGLAGVALSLGYPWLKYHAMGDYDIFLTYSVLPMLGTSYVALGRIYWPLLWLVLPVGLITVAILHINNTRDTCTDARVHIRTLAMQLGIGASLRLYRVEVLLPFVWLLGCMVGGVLPWWSALAFLALLPASKGVGATLRFHTQGVSAISRLDEHTARLQLFFSLLLAVSFLVAGGLS